VLPHQWYCCSRKLQNVTRGDKHSLPRVPFWCGVQLGFTFLSFWSWASKKFLAVFMKLTLLMENMFKKNTIPVNVRARTHTHWHSNTLKPLFVPEIMDFDKNMRIGLSNAKLLKGTVLVPYLCLKINTCTIFTLQHFVTQCLGNVCIEFTNVPLCLFVCLFVLTFCVDSETNTAHFNLNLSSLF
jgi:hypothetical protein